MSMLLASKDIYLSTQQSGAPGTNDQRFSRFRMSLNTTPLVCGTNEQTRLSVTQFNCPKAHYDINQHNNRVDVIFDYGHYTQQGFHVDQHISSWGVASEGEQRIIETGRLGGLC